MTTLAPTPVLEPLARPDAAPSWLQRRLRAGMLRRLAAFDDGAITLTDGEGVHRAGTPGADGLAGELEVLDPRLYTRMALGGTLGAAEAYLDGDWRSPDLVSLLRVFARHLELTARAGGPLSRLGTGLARAAHAVLARNTRRGSRRNIAAHYDLGNDFFALWLDPSMMYSAALYPTPDATLEHAQEAKLDRICQRLELTPDDHLLEIGTGWGALALHAAQRYGCRVTTTTISQAQHDVAMARVAEAGLTDRVTVLLRDYRDLDGTYNKLVSVEMIEAVGHQYFASFMQTCAARLAPHGAALIQLIGLPERRFASHRRSADFIQHYVFPGSCIPSLGALSAELARTDLTTAGSEELTPHYARTLGDWRARFFARLDEVEALGYPPRFLRLWDFYLAYCQAGFAERVITSHQWLLVKPRSRVGLTLADGVAPPPVADATPPDRPLA